MLKVVFVCLGNICRSTLIQSLLSLFDGDPHGKVFKCLSFAGSDKDIADPCYTGDFEATYRDALRGCEGFLDYLKKQCKNPKNVV